MKRNHFLKYIGLGALATACGTKDPEKIFGTPEYSSLKQLNDLNKPFLLLSKTSLPSSIWPEVVALSQLAEDVFEKPSIAEAFRLSPRQYLKSIGMSNVSLDLDCNEVQIALAIVDPQIRKSVKENNVEQFLLLLEEKNLINYAYNSQFQEEFEKILEQELSDEGSIKKYLEKNIEAPESVVVVAIALAVVWIWAAAVQDVAVAVNAAAAVNVYAAVLVQTEVAGPSGVNGCSACHADMKVIEQNPALKIWGIYGEKQQQQDVVEVLVSQNVEQIAQAVEKLKIYKESNKLDGDRLRKIIRQPLVEFMSGHILN